MTRSALVLQTVYFHDNEQSEARRLGEDLYEQLTRPASDPLAFGLVFRCSARCGGTALI